MTLISLYIENMSVLSKCSSSSAMNARDNSKVVPEQPFEEEQEQYTYPCYSHPPISLLPLNPHTHFSNFYPLFSATELNEIKNVPRGSPFPPSEASPLDYSDVLGQHSCAKSDRDSSSEVGGDVSDEEVSLVEFLQNGKAKKKIELLAALVGIDSEEPVTVLTEVVRVLKRLQRINQYS